MSFRFALAVLWCAAFVWQPVMAEQKRSVLKVSRADRSGVVHAMPDVDLVYDMPSDQAAQLQKLVDRFNANSTEGKVVLSRRDWHDGKLPVMLFLGGREQARFLAGGTTHYKPLWQVMKEAGLPLGAGKAVPQMTPAVLDASGRLVGLPALGTPVMYYDKDAFRKAGLDPDRPPATWFALQDALGTLRDKGYACPYASSEPRWIHVENTDAWHDNAFAAGGIKETGLSINDLVMVKHLALMSTWVQSRYLHFFGRDREADTRFANGECAVLTSSSSAYPGLLRQASFDIGLARLPFHDDIHEGPHHTLADGAALWIGSGHERGEYGVAARFVRFLLTAQSQAEWQNELGFLPLGASGMPVLTAAPGMPVQNRLALGALMHKSPTVASRATRLGQRQDIRDIVDSQLEELWSGRKPAKAAVDDAVGHAKLALLARRNTQ